MTYRQVVSFGLIAGLTYDQVMRTPPGMVIDLYLYRRDYDDQQHGLTRKRKEAMS